MIHSFPIRNRHSRVAVFAVVGLLSFLATSRGAQAKTVTLAATAHYFSSTSAILFVVTCQDNLPANGQGRAANAQESAQPRQERIEMRHETVITLRGQKSGEQEQDRETNGQVETVIEEFRDSESNSVYRVMLVPPRPSIQLRTSANFKLAALPDPESLEERYWLGVECIEPPTALRDQLALPHGLLVKSVAPDSPAASIGINQFDVMVDFSGEALSSPTQLSELVQIHRDRPVQVSLVRHGKPVELTVQCEPVPADDDSEDVLMLTTIAHDKVDLRPVQQVVTRWEAMPAEVRNRTNFRMVVVRPGLVLTKGDDVRIERSAVIDDQRELILMAGLEIPGFESAPEQLLFRENGELQVIGDAQMGELPDSMQHWVARLDQMAWQEMPVNVAGRQISLFPNQTIVGSDEVEGVFIADQGFHPSHFDHQLNIITSGNGTEHRLDWDKQFRVRAIETFEHGGEFEFPMDAANGKAYSIEFAPKDLQHKFDRIKVQFDFERNRDRPLETLQKKRDGLQAAIERLQVELDSLDREIKDLEIDDH